MCAEIKQEALRTICNLSIEYLYALSGPFMNDACKLQNYKDKCNFGKIEYRKAICSM